MDQNDDARLKQQAREQKWRNNIELQKHNAKNQKIHDDLGKGLFGGNKTSPNDGAAGGMGIVIAIAICSALAGFPQVGVMIVVGVFAIGIAIRLAAMALGLAFQGIVALVLFPFVALFRALTGRPIFARNFQKNIAQTPQDGFVVRDPQVDAYQTRKGKEPIGWIGFIFRSIIMMAPGFFVMIIGMTFAAKALFGEDATMAVFDVYLSDAAQGLIVVALGPLLAWLLWFRRIRLDRP